MPAHSELNLSSHGWSVRNCRVSPTITFASDPIGSSRNSWMRPSRARWARRIGIHSQYAWYAAARRWAKTAGSWSGSESCSEIDPA
jgi:carbohydrate-selective porin OprB